MSTELHVYLASKRLPRLSQWQTAIESHGVRWQFPPDLDIESHQGLIEMTVNGDYDAFELATLKLPASDFPHSRRTDDAVVVFRSVASGFETSLLAAATLAQVTKGRLYDPQEDRALNTAKAMKLSLGLMGVGGEADDGPGCYWEGRKIPPDEWMARAKSIVVDIDPAYRRSKDNKRIEYLTRDSMGLWKVHSFVRRRNLGVDDYASCFTLSLTEKAGPHSDSPFWVRGRNDDHHSVGRLITFDLGGEWKCDRAGIPRESLHPSKVRPRLNSFDDLRHNCIVAETYLYPWMLNLFRAFARPLEQFLAFTTRVLEEGDFPADSNALRSEVPELDAATLEYFIDAHKWHENPIPKPSEFDPHWKAIAAIVSRTAKLTGLPSIAIATNYRDVPHFSSGPDRLLGNKKRDELGDELWFACMLVAHFDAIWLCRDELGEIRRTLRQL